MKKWIRGAAIALCLGAVVTPLSNVNANQLLMDETITGGWVEGQGYFLTSNQENSNSDNITTNSDNITTFSVPRHKGWSTYAGEFKWGHAETTWYGVRNYSRVQMKTIGPFAQIRDDTGRVLSPIGSSTSYAKSNKVYDGLVTHTFYGKE